MSTVATLWVKLGLDSKGYQSGLSSALSQTQSAGASMGKAFLNVGKLAVAGLAIAGGAVAALSVKSFLAAAAVSELVVVNEVLAKNAGLVIANVRKEAAEVKSMGIEAAASERIVAEFIKAELDLAKASDIARLAQDAAVISQTNSSEAAAAITLGITKMNPLILRNQGIIVDAMEAYDKYAEANGLVASELSKAEKQQAFMNEVLVQGERIAGAYAAAMNEPGKVLRSFPRYFNDIFVAIGSGLEGSFGDAIFAMADFLKGMGAAVDEGGALRPVIEKLGKAFDPLLKALGFGLEEFDFEKLAQRLMPFVDGLAELINVIAAVIRGFQRGGLSGIFEVFEDGSGAIVTILEWFGITGDRAVDMALKIRDGFELIKTGFTAVVDYFKNNEAAVVGVLGAIAIIILSSVIPAILGAVAAALPFIAIFAAIAIAVGVLFAAWQSNWGGIQEKTKAVWDTIKFIFNLIWTWMKLNIPDAIATVVAYWNDTLLPALQAGWAWIDTNLVPLFEALAELLGATLGLAVEALAGIWQNVLAPALETAYEWFNDKILPVIKEVSDWLSNNFEPALDGIATAISKVVDWIKEFVEEIKSVKLPWWMTPGSPTPFETGLLGIADAMKKVNDEGLPSLSVGAMPNASVASVGSTSNQGMNGRAIVEEIRRGNRELLIGIRDGYELAAT